MHTTRGSSPVHPTQDSWSSTLRAPVLILASLLAGSDKNAIAQDWELEPKPGSRFQTLDRDFAQNERDLESLSERFRKEAACRGKLIEVLQILDPATEASEYRKVALEDLYLKATQAWLDKSNAVKSLNTPEKIKTLDALSESYTVLMAVREQLDDKPESDDWMLLRLAVLTGLGYEGLKYSLRAIKPIIKGLKSRKDLSDNFLKFSDKTTIDAVPSSAARPKVCISLNSNQLSGSYPEVSGYVPKRCVELLGSFGMRLGMVVWAEGMSDDGWEIRLDNVNLRKPTINVLDFEKFRPFTRVLSGNFFDSSPSAKVLIGAIVKDVCDGVIAGRWAEPSDRKTLNTWRRQTRFCAKWISGLNQFQSESTLLNDLGNASSLPEGVFKKVLNIELALRRVVSHPFRAVTEMEAILSKFEGLVEVYESSSTRDSKKHIAKYLSSLGNRFNEALILLTPMLRDSGEKPMSTLEDIFDYPNTTNTTTANTTGDSSQLKRFSALYESLLTRFNT